MTKIEKAVKQVSDLRKFYARLRKALHKKATPAVTRR